VADHLPMWPGYHLGAAGMLKLAPFLSLEGQLRAVRLLSLVLSCGCLVAFYRAAQRLDPESALAKAALFAFNPVLYPYFPLAMTDTASLLFLLWALERTLARRYLPASLLTLVAIAMRQSNLAWVLLLLALGYVQDGLAWRRFSLWLATLAGAGALAVAKGGLIFNPEHLRYCPSGLYVSNVWYQGFTFAVLLWPFLTRATFAPLRKAWPLLLAGWGAFLLTYRPDNYFNQFHGYMDNAILRLANTGLASRSLFFLLVALGFLLVLQLDFHRRLKWPLLALCVASVLPIATLGSRYSITAVVLVLLLWRPGPPPSRVRMALTWYVSLTALRVYLLLRAMLFP
jgi:hypothetical protein